MSKIIIYVTSVRNPSFSVPHPFSCFHFFIVFPFFCLYTFHLFLFLIYFRPFHPLSSLYFYFPFSLPFFCPLSFPLLFPPILKRIKSTGNARWVRHWRHDRSSSWALHREHSTLKYKLTIRDFKRVCYIRRIETCSK